MSNTNQPAAHLHMAYRDRATGLQGQFWEGNPQPVRRDFTVCVLGEGGRHAYTDCTVGEAPSLRR